LTVSLIQSENAPSAREGHCLASDGTDLYLFGGGSSSNAGPVQYKDLYVYKTEGDWTSLSTDNGPSARTGAASTLINGTILVCGGLDGEKGWVKGLHAYNVANNTWTRPETALTGGPTARDKFSFAVHDKYVYAFGGFGPQNPLAAVPEEEEEEEDEEDDRGPAVTFSWFNDLYRLDTETLTWQSVTAGGTPPTPRAAFGMVVVGGKMYIIAGRDTQSRTNDVYSFDFDSQSWSKVEVTGAKPSARSFHSCVAVPGTKYIFLHGGVDLSHKHLNDAYLLDTETNTWEAVTLEGSPTGRGNHGGVVVGNHYAMFGGSSDYNMNLQECMNYHNELYKIDFSELV